MHIVTVRQYLNLSQGSIIWQVARSFMDVNSSTALYTTRVLYSRMFSVHLGKWPKLGFSYSRHTAIVRKCSKECNITRKLSAC